MRSVAEALVTDGQGRVLVVYNVGTWWLPTGGVEPGESSAAAARREVLEETGVDVDIGEIVLVEERVTDRTEIWVSLLAQALTTEITLEDPSGKVTDARWVSPAEADRLVPGHPYGIERLLALDGIPHVDKLGDL